MILVLTKGIYECIDADMWPDYVEEMEILGRSILEVFDEAPDAFEWSGELEDSRIKTYALQPIDADTYDEYELDDKIFSWRETWVVPLKRRSL